MGRAAVANRAFAAIEPYRMNLNVLILPGDGIGVEVTREAVRVLQHVARSLRPRTHAESKGLLGGIAIHKTGNPFPEETRKLALDADATLMGAVGLPEFDNAPPEKRPGKRTARHSQDAGGVCESAAGAIV